MKAGQLLLGTCDPLGCPQPVADAAQQGIGLLALELIPRITRAQSMDVLSSQATVAGYRAVLLAAVGASFSQAASTTRAGTRHRSTCSCAYHFVKASASSTAC